MPHPNLVPVKPSVSRSTHSSGVSGSTSTVRVCPFTVSVIAMTTSPSHDAITESYRIAGGLCLGRGDAAQAVRWVVLWSPSLSEGRLCMEWA